MRTWSTCFVVLVLASLSLDTARAQDVVAVSQRASPAVVVLRTYSSDGRASGLGSGFFLSDGRIVTNTHVLEGAARVEVFDISNRLLGSVPYAEALSSSVDLALLPRVAAPDHGLSIAVALPQVGEPVVVIGAPQGLSHTVSTGIVSAIRENDGKTLLQITAPISGGSSGGPVLNASGEVIGVSVSYLTEGQNLNFAIPARDVSALVRSPVGRLAFPPVGSVRAAGENGRGSTGLVGRSGSERYSRIVAGQTAGGRLSTDDTRRDDGSYMDPYVFSGHRGERITVTLRSRDFDAWLVVSEVEGEFVESDDDTGGGTDARVTVTLPRDGDYLIVANSLEADETGDYSLQVERALATTRDTHTEERWVTASEAVGGAVWRYDRTRLRSIGAGRRETWVEVKFETPRTLDGGVRYDRRLTRDEFDCTGRRTRTRDILLYLNGSLVESFDAAPQDSWSSVVPESVGEELHQRICRAPI
jgi:S1-C subfamily serine protease